MASISSIFQHKLFKVIIGLYIALYLLIWASSSLVVKHYAGPMLAQHNLQLSDDSAIRYNPFITQLSISDLTLYKLSDGTPETVMAIGELTAQLTLWQLLFDKVVISQFDVNDGYLNIIHNDGEMIIAGVALPKSEQASTQPSPEAPKNEQTTSPYQVLLPELLISQFHIEIKNNDTPHQVIFEKLLLTAVKANQIQQQGELSINALIDNTSLDLTADANLTDAKGDINSIISLSNYPLNRLTAYAEQLTQLEGLLSLTSEQKLTLTTDGIDLHIKHADVNNKDLVVSLNEQQLTLESFQQSITDLELQIVSGDITHLNGSGSMQLNTAKVLMQKSDETVLSFDALSLTDIGFHREDSPSIKIDSLLLDKLSFSQKHLSTPILIAEDELNVLPPLAHLEQINISNIHINEKSLSIDNITLDSLTGDIIIDKNKNIINLVSLGEESNTEELAATDKANEATEKPVNTEQVQTDKAANKVTNKVTNTNDFTFTLGSFSLINNNEIILADYSVDPSYKRTVFIDTLTLSSISNHVDKKQEKSLFSFVGRSNKYASFDLQGFIQPFVEGGIYYIKGDIKEISLPAISSYTKESTGIEIKTGHLNTGIDVNLTGDKLDGNIVVLLQGLETGIVSNDEVGSLIDQGALPLNMAMGMLKDGDGNVELDVPLSGSTSDPSFGMHSIITLITQKAILSATQDYLMTTFVPYANIVSVAITAGQFALKLRFDDLPYQVKQIEPNQLQQEYLEQFIALMQDKDDARVSICAISTPADIDLNSGIEVSNKVDIKRLKTFGEKREHALKDYLIEEGNINSSRILFCNPKIDSSEGALPRIAISV